MKKLVILLAVLLMSIGTASASVIFNNIPTPLFGSYPSQAYEATSTSQFGDNIAFAGTDRQLTKVTVVLTDWACGNDYTYGGGIYTPSRTGGQACVTTPGSGFDHPITLNIYSVDHSGANPAVGTLLFTKTQTVNIKYRPSYDATNCHTGSGKTGAASPADDSYGMGTWYDPLQDKCVYGYNNVVEFDLSGDGFTAPAEVIYSIAFNTADYGKNPIHSPGPYNSLNFAVPISPATSVGTDVEPNAAFMESTWTGNYCDGGTAGIGTFRRDYGCWTPYTPIAKFEATTPIHEATPGTPYVVTSGSAVVVPGAGKDPVVYYLWVLPDESAAPGTQLNVNASQERNDIYACLVVGDEDSRDTIMDVFTDVRHPDTSFKYQVHAAKITSQTEWEACENAAVAAGLITTADRDRIYYNISSQNNWYMYKVYLPMYYHQPSGLYNVSGYATDTTSRISAPKLANFEWVAATYLELDFDTVNFGTITPGFAKIVNGDLNTCTPDAPTLKNEGNTEVIVGVNFSNFVGNQYHKVITQFDAQLRNIGTPNNNYCNTAGQGLNLTGGIEQKFANAIALCRQEKLDLSIHAPVGLVPDVYAGSITITATPKIVSSPQPGMVYPTDVPAEKCLPTGPTAPCAT